jgi:hypothetical protein
MNRQKANTKQQTDKPSRVSKTVKRLKPAVPYVPIVVQFLVSLSLCVEKTSSQ